MQEHRKIKAINQCFLYSKFNNYTKVMSSAIMESERIDTDTQVFMEDVALELKKSKAPTYLMKVLTSKNTHLIYPKDPLPRSLRVFCAKDIKNKGTKPNIFIDCTGIIVKRDNERYRCKVDTLMAYLITAKNNMIYYSLPDAFTKKANVVVLCTKIFSKLFTHVIDYIANISVISENRDKLLYLSSKYFLMNQLQMDDEDRVNEIAIKASGITESQARIFNIASEGNDLETLPGFVDTVIKLFKIEKLTFSVVIEKWMFLYGSGTAFALEFFPSLLSMVTDAYCGVYLNNQKSIEKILGKDLVELGKLNIYDNSSI